MIRLDVILAIARAEGRLTRRLVRYWVFLVLAWGLGILGYVNYAFILHARFSAYSATVAAINPRYLVALYGTWYLLIFLLGLVFLGFDIRARDDGHVDLLLPLPLAAKEDLQLTHRSSELSVTVGPYRRPPN